ncbi:MAG: serine hydrolase [Saprospiraceae bacterium]|nr:serine hydrolase [Saprospiraceae bacterium]
MRKLGLILIVLLLMSGSCEKEEQIIVPQSGYDWPSNSRSYWPTDGWETASPGGLGIDENKLIKAREFAMNDDLMRSVIIVRDGYIGYEEYFHGGQIDASTNLWSCTKSFASALTGIIYDQGHIENTDQLMIDLMPDYPDFNKITLWNVLTMTTGLHWNEEGPLWVQWILSDDWVQEALERGFRKDPGESFFYSSGNSHMLTSLVKYKSGEYPGKIAKEHLFDPMGIQFTTQDPDTKYTNWQQYLEPLPQSWRTDNQGVECASFGLYLTARDMAKFGYLYLNRGRWEDQQLISEEWVIESTKDHVTDVYERYSYGYQWYLTRIDDEPAFLASGFGGQIIGIVPSLDMVVVLKYEAENPKDPVPGSDHDDMYLFELLVKAAK